MGMDRGALEFIRFEPKRTKLVAGSVDGLAPDNPRAFMSVVKVIEAQKIGGKRA